MNKLTDFTPAEIKAAMAAMEINSTELSHQILVNTDQIVTANFTSQVINKKRKSTGRKVETEIYNILGKELELQKSLRRKR